MKLKFDKNSLHFLKTAETTKLNIFLTAVAWAWKSTIVNYFVENTNERDNVFVALCQTP